MASLCSSAGELFLQAARRPLAGTSSSMSPPNVASSLTPLELQETVLRAGHQVDGLDVGRLPAVELVHLELVLEVRDRAQALDDRARADARARSRRRASRTARRGRSPRSAVASLDEADALLGRRTASCPCAPSRLTTADDDLVEERRRAADDVEVAVGDRVVGARADGDAVVSGSCEWMRIEGVAVAAFVGERQRRARAARGGRSRVTTRAPGASSGGQRSRELAPQRRRAAGTEGRGRPDRMSSPRSRASAERTRAASGARATSSRPSAERLEVGPRRAARAARRARRTSACAAPARERLDARARREPANRSSTRAPSSGAEHRRTAPRARGRTVGRVAAPGGALQPPPAEAPGDDPHRRSRRDRPTRPSSP